MTLLDAPKFDAARDLRKRQVLWVSVGALVVLFIGYWLVAGRPVDWPWNWFTHLRGRSAINAFFKDVEHNDLSSAYGVWIHDPEWMMGAGGLLKEIPLRGQPRERKAPAAVAKAPRIAALVLAAGQSRRMGRNKLLLPIDGTPMVARTVDALIASTATDIVVVTGHQADDVRAVLASRSVAFVHNPDFAAGLSSSVKAGIAALPADADGALVCLGDMPLVGPAHLDRLIAAFNPVEGRLICVPTYDGKRGNPVLWARKFFSEMAGLSGDVGARGLLEQHDDAICEVAMSDAGVLLDVDTPAALDALAAAPR